MIDQYSGKKYRISTDKNFNVRTTARVQTYGDVFLEYAHHPEAKCADEHGNVRNRQTMGLLFRRHVQIREIVPIGKESNKLEDVDAGLIHSGDSVYVKYPDPTRDSWTREVMPKVQTIPLSVLMRETGSSRRMLIKARKGLVSPHLRNRLIIEVTVGRLIHKFGKICSP